MHQFADLPRRETEIRGYQGDLGTTLSDLGPEWDEKRLEQFDLSISSRKRFRCSSRICARPATSVPAASRASPRHTRSG